MATVSIAVQFADGDTLAVAVDGASNYPDALSQLRAEALTAFETAVRKLLEAETE